MKHKDFFDCNQVNQYLNMSVVTYDDKLYQVVRGYPCRDDGVFMLEMKELGVGRYIQVDTNDELLDLHPRPLGYARLTYGGEPYELASVRRIPRRQWKLGTHSNTLVMTTVRMPDDDRMRWHSENSLIVNAGFHKLLRGEFETFDAARQMAHADEVGCPFSRRFAIMPDDSLVHYLTLNKPVGQVVDDNVELDNEFKYLQEVLAEDMNHAG